MRTGFLVLAALLVALPGARAALAQAPCSKADFEAVVDDAAGALRTLAQQNTPPFQAKLRQLKAKRGWSDEHLVKEAEPLVRDAGQTGASGDAPDCRLLVNLRASMATLVETQKAKWTYMFAKIDGELRK